MSHEPPDPVAALSALDDPTRRRAYEHVVAQTGAVSRDEVAGALGIGRTLAAYHLDRLAGEGLLEVAYERRSGRSGPGAGRPAKVYARSQHELTVSVPPRDYGLAARLLAHAAAHDEHGATRHALRAAAAAFGRDVASESAPARLEPVLRERGYEPYEDGAALRLRNCPFHAAAQQHPEVVCDMNLALLEGLLAGLGDAGAEAVLEPGPGRCCVAIRKRAP
jgi:predicted ArsR family transcriptional regulator